MLFMFIAVLTLAALCYSFTVIMMYDKPINKRMEIITMISMGYLVLFVFIICILIFIAGYFKIKLCL